MIEKTTDRKAISGMATKTLVVSAGHPCRSARCGHSETPDFPCYTVARSGGEFGFEIELDGFSGGQHCENSHEYVIRLGGGQFPQTTMRSIEGVGGGVEITIVGDWEMTALRDALSLAMGAGYAEGTVTTYGHDGRVIRHEERFHDPLAHLSTEPVT